jgi:hypothetical protein
MELLTWTVSQLFYPVSCKHKLFRRWAWPYHFFNLAFHNMAVWWPFLLPYLVEISEDPTTNGPWYPLKIWVASSNRLAVNLDSSCYNMAAWQPYLLEIGKDPCTIGPILKLVQLRFLGLHLTRWTHPSIWTVHTCPCSSIYRHFTRSLGIDRSLLLSVKTLLTFELWTSISLE